LAVNWLFEAIELTESTMLLARPGSVGLGNKGRNFSAVGSMRLAGITLPGNGALEANGFFNCRRESRDEKSPFQNASGATVATRVPPPDCRRPS